MAKRSLYTDWPYLAAAALFLVGWGIACSFLPAHVSWADTSLLFLYAAACLALALFLLHRLRRKNERLSMYDSHMGIYSERFFFNALHMECSRSMRHELPLSLIVFSFDSLEETAEQLGKGGEEVEALFIEKVSSTIRSSDIFSTLEGGRFSILLPSTDVDGAKVAANRLKAAITAELKKQRLGQRTSLPFGICGTSPQVKTSQALLDGSLKAHDAALLSPRNKIVTCHDGL